MKPTAIGLYLDVAEGAKPTTEAIESAKETLRADLKTRKLKLLSFKLIESWNVIEKRKTWRVDALFEA